jgi:hypothetical protein
MQAAVARLGCVVMLVSGCSTTPATWTDLTHTGRGIDQRRMDAAACNMMLSQSPLSQPAEATSDMSATLVNVSARMIEQQNFLDNCMLSRGWKED